MATTNKAMSGLELLGKATKKLNRGTVNVASNILSLPKRAYHNAKSKRSSAEADTIRKAREYKNVPNFDTKGNPSVGLKYRTAVDAIRQKRKR